ncbi:MAG: methyltransferase domain-containing protein [Methanobacteriaceae archaeon]|nr:methyltransferase domain-containing protein [Methanobacteriaceae archaeon]
MKIKGPIFIGRSWHEYIEMFNLTPSVLRKGKILDCAAGASSFTAKMNEKGYDITALDLLYDKKPEELEIKCKEHLNILVDALKGLEDNFLWGYFKDVYDLKKQREMVCKEFAEDYRENNGINYIKGDLTQIPFKDNTFSLALCSHLLFIYDHRLSYAFHSESILEMLRVAREVRVYPLVKGQSKISEYLEPLIEKINHTADFELVPVNYRFRRGGYEMLKIIKKETRNFYD